MTKKKLSDDDFQKIMVNCLEAWDNVDRVEIVMKGSELEGVALNNVKVAKANIKEIHTTMFLIDDETKSK